MPLNVSPTDRGGTIAAGGVAQTVMPANANRRAFAMQNTGPADLWFSWLATAVAAAPSFLLAPGAYYECPNEAVPVGALPIIGSITGQPFSAMEC